MSTLQQLNSQQLEAVQHVEGPLLLIAGAGSGKTRVVVNRILHLLELGIPSSHILGVTFTNKAAGEMRERVQALIHKNVFISTFHSLGVRILRQSIDLLDGYKSDFSVYDQEDAKRLIRSCVKEMNLPPKKYSEKALQQWISRLKNDLIEPQDVDRSELLQSVEACFPQIYSLYQSKLREYNAVDFDDLLVLTVRLFREHPEELSRYQNYWKFLLVDEYQDTNKAQYEMIRLLAGEQKNLCVVGDPDQAIYSWRGANIRNILEFEKDFPGAKVIRLEENYRSTETILQAANELIQRNTNRYEKNLWSAQGKGEPLRIYEAMSERDEALFVLKRVEELQERGVPLKEMVVFYRTNFQSRQFEDLFLRARIPYVIVGGLSFYQRREIKDLLAFLRVVHSGTDYISFARTINLPKRGIGDATLAKIQVASEEAHLGILDFCTQLLQEKEGIPKVRLNARQKEGLQNYVSLIHSLRQEYKKKGLHGLVVSAMENSGYLDVLKEDRETFEDRKSNLYELLTKAVEWEESTENPSLKEFLSELALTTTLDEASAVQEDRISLMTVHNGKGLEFDVVFLVGMEQDLFPHVNSRDSEDQQEEERRLCYVGITRGRKKVFLTHAKNRFLWGTSRRMTRSRFIKELPLECLEREFSFGQTLEEVDNEDDLGSEFQVGEKVIHKDFGLGEVLDCYEGSLGLTYDVLFKGERAPKSLVAKYASLKSARGFVAKSTGKDFI